MSTYWQCLINCNAHKKNTGSTIRFCNFASSIEITYMPVAIEPRNQGDLVSTNYILSYFRKRENNLLAAAVQIHDVIDKNEHFHLQSMKSLHFILAQSGNSLIAAVCPLKSI